MDYLPEANLIPEREAETEEPGQDVSQSVDVGPEEQDGYDEVPEPIQEEEPLVNAAPDSPREVRRSRPKT